jgi:hypothetical protein
MPDTWIISTADRTYGPYTIVQMKAFVQEGRLAPHSPTAHTGETEFHPASEDPVLSTLFQSPASSANTETPAPRFGRRDNETAAGELTHYLIMADMKSRSIMGLEEEIFNLGPAYAVLPQVWLLTTDMNINMLRTALVQKLGKLDMLFVVDATHDKAAWFNFGPQADTRIRRMWARTAETAPHAKAS